MNSMPFLNVIDALAFHDLHSLERLDCRDNRNLSHIHPKAFRDNLFQVNSFFATEQLSDLFS